MQQFMYPVSSDYVFVCLFVWLLSLNLVNEFSTVFSSEFKERLIAAAAQKLIVIVIAWDSLAVERQLRV